MKSNEIIYQLNEIILVLILSGKINYHLYNIFYQFANLHIYNNILNMYYIYTTNKILLLLHLIIR